MRSATLPLRIRKYPPSGEIRKDVERFTAEFEALKAAHIYVRYFPGPLTGEYLRISIGTDEQMDALLARIGG